VEKMLNEVTNGDNSADKANAGATQLNDRTKKKLYLDRSSSLLVHRYMSYGRALLVAPERERE
jgi:hypothetical protein